MYDAVLISTHYNYGSDGTIIPAQNDEDYEDLSYIIPLGIIHIAQYLHDCGFKVRVVHIPHEMRSSRRFGMDEDELRKNLENMNRIFKEKGVEIVVVETAVRDMDDLLNGIEVLKKESAYLAEIFV